MNRVGRIKVTISAVRQLNNIPDANVNNTQESLVLLLKLFLIEYLHGQNAILGCATTSQYEQEG